ncbi:MAG: TIGR01459 family HAD-type hydrolase [Parvularcula sp.]|jgi:HAD superfamily hydrolase (TIGR01459 family)|nr:TIGR01459 family HAD-type hydrolase [Parvularcula sp.]
MTEPRLIHGLSEIAGAYDALLCDAWGVIHNGRSLFPGAAEALTRFRADCGPVIVLTNAPRLSAVIPPQLDRLGLPRDAYDAVVTSGDATRQVVAEMADKRFYRIGPSKDDGMFDALGVDVRPLDEAEAIFCTGPNDDSRETPEDYRSVLSAAAARDLPMVCANPDIVVRYGDRLIYCAGALGQLYEELGGKVILGGKPHPPIYELARALVTKTLGKTPERMLAIGDGLDTDIRGANDQGIDVVFVADGIFAEDARHEGSLASHKLEAILAERGVHADFAMDTLAW